MIKPSKKILATLLSLMLVFFGFSSLAGCGVKKDLSVFVFAQSHEVEIYQKIIAQFTEETGITVDYEIEEEKYFDLLNADLQGNTAKDVFYVRPGDVRAHANQKTVLNLSKEGLVTEEEIQNVWPQAIDFFRYDGTINNQGDIYALPKDYSQYVLGFNRKKVQEDTDVMARLAPYLWDPSKGDYASFAGADLTVYTAGHVVKETYKNVKIPGLPGDKDANGNDIVFTFDEFGALAYLCSDTAQWEEEPLSSTYGTAFWEEMCLMAYVWGAEGEFLKENNTQVNFDSDGFREGYEGFLEVNNKWNAGSSGSTKSGYDMFVAGNLVFYPVGTWDIAYFDKYNDVLDYDLMPWPISNRYASASMADRQNKWYARVDSVGYGIYAGTRNQQAAVQFIKYLSINEKIQLQLTQMGAQIPNTKSVAEGAYLNNEIKDVNGKDLAPSNKQLLLDIANGSNGHFGPTVYTYNDEWFSEFFTGAQAKLWATPPASPAYSVADYVKEYSVKAQQKLNDAIELEQDQKQ